jgi:hypothetical protein
MFGLIAQFRRTRSRRLLVVLAGVVILIGQIGLPVPVRVKKDKSRPFPCMDRACGCHSAETCWKSCCCHSKTERIAWAKRYGVEIPRELNEAPDDPAPNTVALCDHPHSKSLSLRGSPKAISERTSLGNCCSKSGSRQECQRGKDGHQVQISKPQAQNSQSEESEDEGWLSWQQFRECRGAPNLWCVSMVSLPPPPTVEVVAIEVSGSYAAVAPEVLVSIELDPPVPPPKIG